MGILVIDKPAGYTSHDVVARLRRVLGVKRIGHGGTLDPLATGVLPVCIGRATRMAEYFIRWPKTYRFTIRLGVSTDTYDADGAVTAERDASGVTAADIEAALPRFRGDIRQAPPPYSAVKRAGRPLYSYARAGETVAVAERPVRVARLTLLSCHPPDAELEMECGSGTYVRTLVHDLGETLGCGAHVLTLTRTAVGPFTVDHAVTLDQIEAVVEAGTWADLLQPPDVVLADTPVVTLDVDHARAVISGRPVVIPGAISAAEGALGRAYDRAGRFLAVLSFDPSVSGWRARKVFAD